MKWIHRVSVPTALVAVLCGMTFLAARPGETVVPKSSPPLVHQVFFHLKNDIPAARADALMADARRFLAPIPSVRGFWIGPPAAKGSPRYAVRDYQVGMLMLFDDQKGLDDYLNHPQHLRFRDTWLPRFDRVQVYDFVNRRE